MSATLGVLATLAGVSIFIMGILVYLFPSTKDFVPDDFKRIISIRVGVYIFLVGILLLRFS